MDSLKKIDGYDTGRVNVRSRLKAGISSFDKDVSSTLEGGGRIENMAVGSCCTCSLSCAPSEPDIPRGSDNGASAREQRSASAGSGGGIGCAAFLGAVGFFSHEVIEDCSIAVV